jgi:molybdenum cofactor biosynthesis protein A
MLTDTHHRVHNYLRISLTDSCNFRCSYCMPEEEIQCMPHAQLMQAEEIVNLAKVFVHLGVTKIRLTGGEPLVRKEFPQIVEALSGLPVELTFTSNGVLVHKHIDLMKKAGIRSVNISLDTLKPEVFFRLTRRDKFQEVWDNILLLLQEGFRVKINVVAMTGQVESELADFIRLTRHLPLHIRFIEFMPFDGNGWDSAKVLTARQMLSHVESDFDIVKLKDEPHATARKYQVVGYTGTFAFITTMSEHFCGDCNRLRLTADGKIKNCLFGKEEIDLLSALRAGEEVEPLIRQSVRRKHAALGGQLAASYLENKPEQLVNRSMINIGG